MKYSHIVFDIDGTMQDTAEAIFTSLQDTLETLTGRRPPLSEIQVVMGVTGEDGLKALGIPEGDIPAVLALWNENLIKYDHTVRVFPGIVELLEALSAAGCALGTVTSKTYEEYEQGFVPCPISKYFPIAVRAEDTEEHKPSPQPLEKYLALAGASREETLYIGDSVYDSACARNAGVDFALAVWGSATRDIPARYYPQHPGDLLEMIGLK